MIDPRPVLRSALVCALFCGLSPLACTGGEGGSTGSTGDASTGGSSAGATEAATGSTGGGSTGGGGTGSTGAPTTGEASSSGGSGESSGTGGAAWCYGWEESDAPPWLELENKAMQPLTGGATLPLECGGQGTFMFGIYPRFGGFEPAGDLLDFDLVVDVEGFNDNPEGHFYSAAPVSYYVSCEQILGGVVGVLPVFPFDNLADLAALDGKPATLHVVMHAPGGDVVVDTDAVLSVVKDDSWTFCGG